MEFSKERIEELKAKFGTIHKLTVEDKSALLKSPDRKTLSYASSVATKDPMKFNEIILNNCWIEGDEEIRTNDAYFLGAAAQIAELIEVKKATLEKL